MFIRKRMLIVMLLLISVSLVMVACSMFKATEKRLVEVHCQCPPFVGNQVPFGIEELD